ncbi:nucleoside-diphosphate sugar epimerase/dehydratase [Aureimonas populi]|uniref:SDR family NAD(P)-dependent oxidoreductase n=1 Tax=Aureimonas populi TaxID=1701758 RepID=A0ABW5CI71_9HYPH|nr:nucleoside-diphosphate sugar epimerase/dehydratase [Aureimonas populi]
MTRLRVHFSRALLLRGLASIHDVLMGGASLMLAFVLRLDIERVLANPVPYVFASGIFGLMVGIVGLLLGMNRGVWRYASLPDLVAILKVATISVMLFVVAHFLLVRLESVPRSSVLIAWSFLVVLLAAPRAIYRLYRNRVDRRRDIRSHPHAQRKRVLLVGAGDNAESFLKTLNEQGASAFEVLGIIDERGRRTGRFIRGVPILGDVEKLPQIVERFRKRRRKPEALILTRTKEEYESQARIEDLIQAAAELGLEMLRLPNVLDMREMDAGSEVRPIRLEDLLQRNPLKLDASTMAAMINGRTVLITGAGGSIGSELARQIVELEPAGLVLVDASEYLLYTIESELRQLGRPVPVHACLCNIRERTSIGRVLAEHRPAVVFHAAALKHVPMVEAQPLEGLFTNVIGTRNVAEAAIETGAGAMVMVSTDKAVNPANVMGASKRMAEMFCQAMDLASGEGGTRFVTVRFGNVLGSAGSVVPLFERQLKAGGPLTVTHPDIERYFMTISEACLLVIQAAAKSLGNREERGRIFVVDMGAPVKIMDLARNVIRLSGLRPDIDVRIVYTGLRPGEKLYEELFDRRETLGETDVSGVLVAFPRSIERALVLRIFDEMRRLIEIQDLAGALRLLKSTVPEFKPGPHIEALMEGRPMPSGADQTPAL